MSDCPTELLELFVEHVLDESTLRNLRAVDSTFCVLATPRAFRNVHATNSLQSAIGLRCLMETPALAKNVESVVFRWTDPPDAIRQGEMNDRGGIEHVCTDSCCVPDLMAQRTMHIALTAAIMNPE